MIPLVSALSLRARLAISAACGCRFDFFKQWFGPVILNSLFVPFNEASSNPSNSLFSVPAGCSTLIGLVSPLSIN